MTKKKKVALVLIIVVVLYIALGLVSNSLSKEECERRVAEWLWRDIMKENEFRIPEGATPEMIAILDSVGARYLPKGTPGYKTITYEGREVKKFSSPFGYVMPGYTSLPFVVSVEWGWMLDLLYGSGHTRRFLCIFGLVIELWDSSGGGGWEI